MTDPYKHPKWQRKRLEILQRDNFTCVACGDTESTLHVHHFSYAGQVWEVPNEWLQTLCESCHDYFGPHPKGGVYWHSKGSDVPALVAVCWCPNCGGFKFKDKGTWFKCVSCGWDCGQYLEKGGFALGQKIEVVNEQKPKKRKEYSIAWLQGMVTRVKKAGATDLQIFEAIFPSHPAVEVIQLAADATRDLLVKKRDGVLSLDEEIAAVCALVAMRRKIQEILSACTAEATDGSAG